MIYLNPFKFTPKHEVLAFEDQSSTPSDPISGHTIAYTKTDGSLYIKSGSTEKLVSDFIKKFTFSHLDFDYAEPEDLFKTCTISASTHGLGTNFSIISVHLDDSDNTYLISGLINAHKVNSSGDVKITATSGLTSFLLDGYVLLARV